MKVCSTTFLSLSWPKLLSGKYWFSWFSGWFSWYSNTGSASFQVGSAGIQKQSTGFWTSSAGHSTGFQSGGNRFNRFLHCSLFSASLLCQPKSCAQLFKKPVQPVLGPVQPVFGQKSQKRLVLEPHLYILTPTSLPHRSARPKPHF